MRQTFPSRTTCADCSKLTNMPTYSLAIFPFARWQLTVYTLLTVVLWKVWPLSVSEWPGSSSSRCVTHMTRRAAGLAQYSTASVTDWPASTDTLCTAG